MLASFRLLASVIGLVASVAASGLDREIVLAPHEGAEREDGEIRRWQDRVAGKSAVAADYDRLAWAFVAKARRTFDDGFYKLAEKTADVRDARFGASPDSQLLRGHVRHNLHRFHDAEKIARALTTSRGEAADFALLSDVLMEQGDLVGAVDACQRLANLRPGLEAYSRIAHLRWLKGDLAGATGAMEMAMRATAPGEAERKAWALARLSGYYLQAGRADAALTAAEAAGHHAADYAPALLARGRALLAVGRKEAAVESLRRAAELNPLPEFQWWLADATRAAGDEAGAVAIEAALRRRGEQGDPRTLALFLATRGINATEAVRLARAELAERADVHTRDALAWALLLHGDTTAAQAEMQRALAEGTRDARLFLHAGEIAWQGGQIAAARGYFTAAQPLAAALTPSERALLERRQNVSSSHQSP
jgi:tetratricopeptide (TPR) repeat protein